MSSRSIALSLVLAGDDFGREVVAALDELLHSLPDVYRLAVRTAEGDLGDLRAELTRLENTEAIKDLGYTALGSDVGSLRVHLYVVGDLASGALDHAALERLAADHPEDLISCVCLGGDGSAPTKALLRDLCGAAARPYLVAPSAGGHGLARDTLVGGVAGFVFTSICHRTDAVGLPDPDTVFTLGFAGKIGLTGAAQRQLARHTSLKLCRLQREKERHPDGSDVRRDLDDWLARWSPHRLGDDLFTPEHAGVPDRERIPAVVTWVPDEAGDNLVVQLDRAAVALALDEKQPQTWAAGIRRFSRVFDMSQAVRWNTMLARARQAVGARVRDEMLDGFKAVLGRTVQPLGAAAEVLTELRAHLERGVQPETTPDRDLDAALADLDNAVERMPDALALSLRMALWVVPALVIGVGLFDLFYTGVRGVVFPVLYAIVLAAIGVGWPALTITRARRALYRARARAIDAMVTRQEGIVSENAAGYLQELLGEVATELAAADEVRLAHVEDLGRTDDVLTAAVMAEMPSPLTLEPVITSGDEFARAHDQLGIDSRDWLARAVADGCFAVAEEGDRAEALADWCLARMAEPGRVRLPDFQALWEIRVQCRGAGSLDDAVREVWRRAAPFAGGTPRSEVGLFLCTADLETSVRKVVDTSGDFGECRVEVAQDAPILACLRLGSLGPE